METPPLTRGRRTDYLRRHLRDRNTPAYAGKTAKKFRDFIELQKHPRLRGEDSASAQRRASARETPPLTRGRLLDNSRMNLGGRNTPAYAGKTRCTRRAPPLREKHPRLRGEDVCGLAFVPCAVETPPLTRGRLRHFVQVLRASGNTPAYAGKTAWQLYGVVQYRETPPLTRGRPCVSAVPRRAIRNTPAYAGKTTLRKCRLTCLRKHPRLRGEDSMGAFAR